MRYTIPLFALAACWQTPVPEITPDSPAEPWPADASVGASYTLSFPEAQAQYMQVEAVFPKTGDSLELYMANWTPGSYVVRDYARNLEEVTASGDGRALSISKSDVNHWTVDSKGVDDVIVRYKVYAASLSVQNNWVEADLAVLNGAPTFLTATGREEQPHDVRIVRPDAWSGLATALPPHPSKEAHRFRAPDLDTLIDSPVLLGETTTHTFTIEEVPHQLVNLRENGIWDGPRSATDTERIVRTQVAFWGGMPYRQYLFLNVVEGGHGGLEHKDSTLMLVSPWATHDDKAYQKWLGLVSHEFFHTWNVKRLRPAELGPFDYQNQPPTRSLWIAEGLTSYYDDLLLARAGVYSDAEYLTRMSDNVRKVRSKPGRFVRSLEDASFDAWIKHYQKDANHDNVSVSYYIKGSVVGWMLDARIRQASGGASSLDDVMRDLYQAHSGDQGYTPEQFQAACETRAGVPLNDFFDRYVRGTEELDLTTAFQVFGVRETPPPEPIAATRKEPNPDQPEVEEKPPVLGVAAAGTRVEHVVRDSPAWKAGILVKDEIIAIEGYRVRNLPGSLKVLEAGKPLTVLLSRRDRLMEVQVTLYEAPVEPGTLQVDPDALVVAKETREAWLGPQLDRSGKLAIAEQAVERPEEEADSDVPEPVPAESDAAEQ